ncbi:hypothetical protein D3C85_1827870 [compost metagenome]
MTRALRRRLWDVQTNGEGAQDDPSEAFKAWRDIMDKNKKLQDDEKTPSASLVEFYYGDDERKDLD